MATDNRRVAAYLPPEVDKAFVAFKVERGLATQEDPHQNDSKALVQLLSEFLKVAHSVSHESESKILGQIASLEQRITALELRVDDNQRLAEGVKDELAESLGREVSTSNPGQMSLLDVSASDPSGGHEVGERSSFPLPDKERIPGNLLEGLGRSEMAKRLQIHPDNLTKKKRQGAKFFLEWSQSKDPDAIPWVYEDGKYMPVAND